MGPAQSYTARAYTPQKAVYRIWHEITSQPLPSGPVSWIMAYWSFHEALRCLYSKKKAAMPVMLRVAEEGGEHPHAMTMQIV
jgi:hypothetical protein